MIASFFINLFAKFSFSAIKDFVLNKNFLLFVFLIGVLYFIHAQQKEYNAMILKKNQISIELNQIEANLGTAKARLANMQKEKEIADKLYIDIKKKYNDIDDKFESSRLTIKHLRETKGNPDDKILEIQITGNIADVANGRVLPQK